MAVQGIPTDEDRERMIEESRQAFIRRIERETESSNSGLALSLSGARLDVLTFRGVEYDVPLMPYADGFELTTLWATLADISRAASVREAAGEAYIRRGEVPPEVYTVEQYAAMLSALKRAVAIFWRLVHVREKRRGWIARRVQYARTAIDLARHPERYRNPFETASQSEVATLFAFFLRCRTKSTVRLHATSSSKETATTTR